jgi:PAS domain S-box-containing protein
MSAHEKELQLIFSNHPDGMIVLGLDDTPRLVNPAACRLLERAQADLLSDRLDLALVANGEAELEISLAAGGVRILAVRAQPVEWEDAPARLICLRDVTLERTTEKQLREREEKYRLFTEHSRDVVWTLDPETLRFLYVSPAVKRLRGYSPEEIIAEPMDAALTPLAAAYVRGVILNDLREFQTGKFNSERFKVDEVEQPCKDGSIIWTEVITCYIHNEKTGKDEILGVTRDITGRRQMESALRESEKRHVDTLNSVRDGIWEWYVQTGRLVVSNNFSNNLGFSENEYAPDFSSLLSQIHPDDQVQVSASVAQTALTGAPINLDMRMRMKSGEWHWFSLRGGVVEQDGAGRVVRVLGTLGDIEQRKQVEEQLHHAQRDLERRVVERTAELQLANLELEKAAHMKDEFLASMSHELRTPLTGILGLSQVLQMQTYGVLSEKQQIALHNIEKSGKHLLDLINDILDFTRLEAGRMKLSFGPCSLGDICRSSLKTITAQASAKQQHVSLDIQPDVISLIADGRRLGQVLNNLLSNANKFTPVGGSLGIVVRGLDTGQPVEVTVWDTGIGIAADELPKLFQPFSQLDASLDRRYSGTGLGLSLSRGLVSLHGGSISVESEPGQGSRFRISLPWGPSTNSEALAR